MRVALYARYSSDLQNAKSADDQLAMLRQTIKAKGWTEVAAFKDEAISGARILNRPGMMKLLDEAKERRFDVIYAEAMDRISRDQADVALIYRQLEYLGIKIHTASEGPVGILQAGFSGIMGQIFLQQLGEKTLRGQIANAARGKSGGGSCYGYVSVAGELSIHPEQAAVVLRTFLEYEGGRSPRDIAHRLNAEGIPGDRAPRRGVTETTRSS